MGVSPLLVLGLGLVCQVADRLSSFRLRSGNGVPGGTGHWAVLASM